MTFHRTIQVRSTRRLELVDLTDRIRGLIAESTIRDGICHIFVTGSTAAIIVNENDDPQLLDDFLDALDRLVPEGRWRHDRIDDNGAAHIKAAVLGPAEIVPVHNGEISLGRWQNIFLCEFDGPRASRDLIVTITGD